MRVGVVGGAGFIGSHIVDALVAAGHDVRVFDTMAPHRPDVRHIVPDLTNLGGTTLALAGGYDAIYVVTAVEYGESLHRIPVECVQARIMAVAYVLEAARRTGAGRVILASRTAVYALADVDGHEVSEDTPLCIGRVKDLDVATMLAAEALCQAYQTLYGLDTTILRYGEPYGPRAPAGTALASLVGQALGGQPIVVDGDGRDGGPLVHVEDLARGSVAALADVARNQTYNLDGVGRLTAIEIVESLRGVFPGLIVQRVPARSRDVLPLPRTISSQKALAQLGWKPRVPFGEGVAGYIAFVRARNGHTAVDSRGRPGTEPAGSATSGTCR